jgi:uncharacterized NAD-dependent epimerase/dehydratase family protein
VHTVGNDVSVGKMVAALELTEALRQAGRDASFLATGQTGILISGGGVAVDHVLSDFVAGAIEAELLKEQGRDFVVVEGQGSICHPLYSGVTLGLLHGCAPQTMVLVHDPTRETAGGTTLPIPPIEELIDLYERVASLMTPSRVVAVAANTASMSEAEARRTVGEIEERVGLVTVDVLRQGSEPVVEAILRRHEELGLGGCT